MVATVSARLRALSRLRWPWIAPVALMLLALLLMPLHERWYAFVGNYDVQGDDQRIEWLYTVALLRASSGFVYGQLMALGLGAVLGRQFVHIGQRGRGTAPLLSTMVAAALTGTALALVNLAVVVPVAVAGSGWSASLAEARVLGPDLVHDLGFWQVLLVGVVSFPLWAVAGAGAAVLTGPNRRVVPAISAWLLLGLVLAGVLVLWSERTPVVLTAVLLSPAYGSLAAAFDTGAGGTTVTVSLLAAGAGYAFLLVTAASRATRRRASRAARRGGDGSGQVGPEPGGAPTDAGSR
ncbi:hypothetical protein [Micromonospora pisi]|nr:hypothetical protein [Micromonospora pisi]